MKYLITGTGRGLGKALAAEIKSRGDEVVAMDRYDWDVRQPNHFDDTFDRVIVNAAIKDDKTALETDPEKVLDILNVNAVGALRTVQAVKDCIGPGAKIIMLTSQMGSSAMTGGITLHGRYGDHYIQPSYSVAYRMSKAALNKLTQCLALDYVSKDIGVYALDPGWPKTDMGGQFATMDTDWTAQTILNTIEKLSMEDTGTFVDWDGKKLEW